MESNQSVSQGPGEADDDRRPAELTQIAPLVISTGQLLYWLPRVVVMGREWLGHVRSGLDSGHHP